jgi:hypothetical protein
MGCSTATKSGRSGLISATSCCAIDAAFSSALSPSALISPVLMDDSDEPGSYQASPSS